MAMEPSTPANAHVHVDKYVVAATWRGRDVRVQASLVPRYFFTTADITVDVDAVTVLHTGGQKKVTGLVREQFDGHVVELTWGLGAPQLGFPVAVRIDGDVVLDEVPIPIRNRWLVFVPIVVVPLVVVAVLKIVQHLLP